MQTNANKNSLSPEIIQKVSNEVTNLKTCKKDWEVVKTKIDERIKALRNNLENDAKSIDKSNIPEQKILLKRCKNFSESQIKKLHKFKRGAANDSKKTIHHLIHATASHAKRHSLKLGIH